MRAGSDFVPVPHAVLSGLFGRHPQPFIFHNWVIYPPAIKQDGSIHVGLGFALANKGPGIARELYVNAKFFPPRGGSEVKFQTLDETNWTGRFALDHLLNLISTDSYKLAPGGVAEPFSIELYLRPPFASDLFYEITFGHQNWPTLKLAATTQLVTIADAYIRFTAGLGEPHAETRKGFMDEVLPLTDYGRDDLTQQEYDLLLGGEV
jgi:hypothetical protein